MNHPQAQGQLTIGALAGRTGFNVSAIRYYEQVGLIAPAARSAGGHRVYGAQVQEVLTLVRHCRDFGFSIDETRALVALSTSDATDCVAARDIAQAHLTAVSSKLAELQALERSLKKYVQACTNGCAGGPAPECTILKDLSLQPSAPAASGCCG
ncbi:MAG: helix-turn-helix domain-containing protein [Burkholderiales bacterium]|nr:helix-turn-helix domain-containing protein [Burkholderiales bacterium]